MRQPQRSIINCATNDRSTARTRRHNVAAHQVSFSLLVLFLSLSLLLLLVLGLNHFLISIISLFMCAARIYLSDVQQPLATAHSLSLSLSLYLSHLTYEKYNFPSHWIILTGLGMPQLLWHINTMGLSVCTARTTDEIITNHHLHCHHYHLGRAAPSIEWPDRVN